MSALDKLGSIVNILEERKKSTKDLSEVSEKKSRTNVGSHSSFKSLNSDSEDAEKAKVNSNSETDEVGFEQEIQNKVSEKVTEEGKSDIEEEEKSVSGSSIDESESE